MHIQHRGSRILPENFHAESRMDTDGRKVFCVDAREAGRRLDRVVSSRICDVSRHRASLLIRDGQVTVDNDPKKASYRVRAGETIAVAPAPLTAASDRPEAIPLDILYEDADVLAINKQAGLVVHPAPGHPAGTLVNGLLHHCPDLEGIGGQRRPGIVHRLDKDTSGVLLVAKTAFAHEALSRQFKARQVLKRYLALVFGAVAGGSGRIDLPIGRHPVDRKKMSAASRRGRAAETLWRVERRYGDVTLLCVTPGTGRTHQIRVHCAAMHHPIVGDPVYGGTRNRVRSLRPDTSGCVSTARRQFLHAASITFAHPRSEAPVRVAAPVPEDMQNVLDCLNRCCPESG
jgi:23S rRNA pseudouridine1911/1915/1917 synthase